MELEELDISNFFPYYPSVDNDDFTKKFMKRRNCIKKNLQKMMKMY